MKKEVQKIGITSNVIILGRHDQSQMCDQSQECVQAETISQCGQNILPDPNQRPIHLGIGTSIIFESESDIDYHLKRIKAMQSSDFEKEKGNLMARVFLRNTGSLNDHKGNYIINEKDLFSWFENLDYLKSYTEWDTL